MQRRALLAAACGVATLTTQAADTMRIVVAYPPGGISDRVARVFARQFAEVLGLPVVVENRPGAGGSLALNALARTPGDHRTLAFCAISPLALSPHFGIAAPRVQPVSGVMHTPLLLVGTPALDADDFAGMVRLARAQPGALRWATSGLATIGHLALEQVRHELRVDVVHVPYSGGGPQLQDALAGRFELLSTNLAPLQIEYVRSSRLVPLALGAPARSHLLPGLPTFAELGCPGANQSSLFGLFAAGDAPPDEVRRLNTACAAVLAQPAFRSMLTDAGNQPAEGSAADFAREIARQSAANARLVATLPRR
jgi:tripartite-type tricarboxylate transporter receptor subunit TctC